MEKKNLQNDTMESLVMLWSNRKFTTLQENVYTHIMKHIFSDMTKNADIWNEDISKICKTLQFTSNKSPYIVLNSDSFTKHNSEFFIKSLKEMMKNLITVKSGNQTVAVFPIFSLVKRQENSNKVECHFHSLAIRYLLYFGNGAGMYSFNVAVSLGSARFSQLYKIISANLNNKNNGCFEVTMEGFLEEFSLINKNYSYIQKKMLVPLKEKLENNPRCGITFDFEPIVEEKKYVRFSENRNSVGRPKNIGIKFHVYEKPSSGVHIK